MVKVEERGEETPRICIVTRGGMRIGTNTSTLDVNQKAWVKKATNPLPKFYLLKKKETYREARKEVTIVEWDATFIQQP